MTHANFYFSAHTSDQFLVSTSDDSQSEEMCHLADVHMADAGCHPHRCTCHCHSHWCSPSVGNPSGLSRQPLIWSECHDRLESLCSHNHRHPSVVPCNQSNRHRAQCQRNRTPEPVLSRQLRFARRWQRWSSFGYHRLSLLTIVLLALCTFPGGLSTPNRDAWRHHPSVSSPPKAKAHRNFALSPAAPHRSSYATNFQPNGAASPHRRAPSAGLANNNPYMNSQLLSVPFSPNQQLLYQHQMLPHHSMFPMSAQPTVSAGQALSHQMPNTSRNKVNQFDANHVHMLATNSIRSKGSKWWDPRGQSQLSLDQMTHMDGRHANAILPTNSVSNNINLPLRKKQRRLARENPGLLNAVSKAMRTAIAECQNQLKDHRWNCPVNDWKKGKNVFGKIIQTGCRETAFVYALTSAAVAHSIARACSEGMIETCTCDNTPSKQQKSDTDWVWGGCSDNIKFGYKYARMFLDAYEKGRDQRFVMNLHNNEAGRLHVSNQMRRECKCHGMSGSCTVKTCWMRLASFREIGDNLKERFDKASRVRVSNDFRGIARNKYKYKKSVQLETYEKGYPSPTSTDLIFFEESPDFCIANPKYGLAGTQGRECNASSISVDSCNLVCCDRGYTTEEIEVTERCNCTFRWCCEVNCSLCKVKKKIHKCK